MLNKRKIAILIIVAAFVLSLSACMAADSGDLPSFDLSGAEPRFLENLPHNELTWLVEMPNVGELDYVLDLTENDRYGIFWKDISSEQSKIWLDGLIESGFSKVQYAANEVSVGTILKKDDVYLSISYSENVLSVLIAKKYE